MQKRKQATLANLLLSQLLAGSLGPPTIKTNIYIYIYIYTIYALPFFQVFSSKPKTSSWQGSRHFLFWVFMFFFFSFGHTSPINELPIETASRVLTVTIQFFSVEDVGRYFQPKTLWLKSPCEREIPICISLQVWFRKNGKFVLGPCLSSRIGRFPRSKLVA